MYVQIEEKDLQNPRIEVFLQRPYCLTYKQPQGTKIGAHHKIFESHYFGNRRLVSRKSGWCVCRPVLYSIRPYCSDCWAEDIFLQSIWFFPQGFLYELVAWKFGIWTRGHSKYDVASFRLVCIVATHLTYTASYYGRRAPTDNVPAEVSFTAGRPSIFFVHAINLSLTTSHSGTVLRSASNGKR